LVIEFRHSTDMSVIG